MSAATATSLVVHVLELDVEASVDVGEGARQDLLPAVQLEVGRVDVPLIERALKALHPILLHGLHTPRLSMTYERLPKLPFGVFRGAGAT